MVIVSDATPIISFLKMNRLDILQKLFGEVLLPEAVYGEITSNEAFSQEAEQVRNCPFLKRVGVGNREAVDILMRAAGLDLGESEAIVFSDENHADILIVDEVRARHVATAMKLRITGTIGILIAANEKGLLDKTEAMKCAEILRASQRHVSETLFKTLAEHLK